MSYGGGNLGNHAWSLPEEESRPFIQKALEGINFFDTANRYSLGNSEEILGRAIRQGPWLFRSPVSGSGIRRLDGEAVGRPPPREDPAQRRHALAGGFDAPPAPALSSAGDDSRPHHVF